MTYKAILARMLAQVEAWAKQQGITLDTREGSLIRTALSPAALELQQAYLELGEVLSESFADTQSRDFLIRRCKERGVAPTPATAAIRRGEFNLAVPIGSRFSLRGLHYAVTEHIEGHAFRMLCETPGSVGNTQSGDMIPVEYIPGLTTATLGAVLTPGEDEEGTEHLRIRYFNSLNEQAFGGNVRDYVQKTSTLPGVGGVKVYPVWSGGGTVKLVLSDAEHKVPSTELTEAVQAALDPVRSHGMGVGIAPIGHSVTVEGVRGKTVAVATHLTFEAGWDWAAVKPYAENAIVAYLQELAAEWDAVHWEHDPAATLIVRISAVDTRLLELEGVLDAERTTLNGTAANLPLNPNEIPVFGGVIHG